MNVIEEGIKVFDKEILALRQTSSCLGENFETIARTVADCRGKTLLIGVGKSGHIAKKISSTFSSLGIPSFFIHPSEALHGDLGAITSNDLVIIISNSGESDEITTLLPAIKRIGSKIIAITQNENSRLAKNADIVQLMPKYREADPLELAPTSSSTAVLCLGDALAVVISKLNGFNNKSFGELHPAGSLGKKLAYRVADVMNTGDSMPVVNRNVLMKDAIIELSKKGLGVVLIVDNDRLVGIVTDGDLRRQLEKGVDIYSLKAVSIMTDNPITIQKDRLAIEALEIMRESNVACLPVLNNDTIVGCIRVQDILKVGII